MHSSGGHSSAERDRSAESLVHPVGRALGEGLLFDFIHEVLGGRLNIDPALIFQSLTPFTVGKPLRSVVPTVVFDDDLYIRIGHIQIQDFSIAQAELEIGHGAGKPIPNQGDSAAAFLRGVRVLSHEAEGLLHFSDSSNGPLPVGVRIRIEIVETFHVFMKILEPHPVESRGSPHHGISEHD